ncbi:hypothetical protein [Halalkalicoccus salilacus]|uniref:hypothetical protein n=1 Tax=Halalkalicoccus salilacus TaxID=3117459 RepID=UPI00300E945C
MSKVISESPIKPTTDDESEIEALLDSVDLSIAELERKIDSGRVRNPETDSVKIKYHRALGYMLRTKLKIFEAKKHDEFEQRLAELERELIPEADHVDVSESELRAEIECVRGERS